MKNKKVFIITDLGGGDGGKGGVVHGVSSKMRAHTVIKVGGAQGSHGVRTSKGQSFNFSHFGCGTFEGVLTHVSPLMVIDPIRLLEEGNDLRFKKGIPETWDMLTVDENCLCSIPYHGITSRLRELSKKDQQKGTVGVGTGEATIDAELHPELALYVKDISQPGLREKIEAIRNFQIKKLKPIIENLDNRLKSDKNFWDEELMLLNAPEFIDWIFDRLNDFQKHVRVVSSEHLKEKILSKDGVAVVESSHGILTDRYYGFHPYVSRLRTVPSRVIDFLETIGYEDEIVHLGVTRAYQIRHGAGPMVTEDPELVDKLLPGSAKDDNRWQGKVRVGPLDFVALRYSIEVCGGPEAFDGIAVTWLDQIQEIGSWQTCDAYQGVEDSNFFSSTGSILVRRGEDENQIQHQEALGKQLQACKPVVQSESLAPFSDQSLVSLVSEVMIDKLGVPLKMVSLGSTELHKRYL
ncbi:MAG: adenylosuccinate synthetase [Candidatus Paceibacterota bacterium]